MATFPTPTNGVGVAAKIVVPGTPGVGTSTTPGYNNVVLSLSGANGPKSFQLNPTIEDAAGTPITPGTAFTLTAVAASTPGALTLSAAAAAVAGVTAYTGTITGGGSNAFAGFTFTVAGFSTAANNGTFICTASTTTVLTLENVNGAVESHAATATGAEGTAVYTGTITGGGSNAFAGKTFVVAGFSTAANNGSFIATASGTTTLTLDNASAAAETHAATATTEEVSTNLTFSTDGSKNATVAGGSTYANVVSVSASGNLTTNAVEGGSVVEVSYPTFNNGSGTIAVAGNNLPVNKIYAEVNVTVVS